MHHTAASDQQLTRGPKRDNLSSSGVHHFSLRLRHAEIPRVTVLEGCVDEGLCGKEIIPQCDPERILQCLSSAPRCLLGTQEM